MVILILIPNFLGLLGRQYGFIQPFYKTNTTLNYLLEDANLSTKYSDMFFTLCHFASFWLTAVGKERFFTAISMRFPAM